MFTAILVAPQACRLQVLRPRHGSRLQDHSGQQRVSPIYAISPELPWSLFRWDVGYLNILLLLVQIKGLYLGAITSLLHSKVLLEPSFPL